MSKPLLDKIAEYKGAQLRELMLVLPALSRLQMWMVLRELKAAGLVQKPNALEQPVGIQVLLLSRYASKEED